MKRMIECSIKGDWGDTKRFLRRAKRINIPAILQKYGPIGVDALIKATPKDTGKTSQSWGYEITYDAEGNAQLLWTNSNVNNHVNIALIIQYGHGTKSGAYVQGIDYIDPALKSVFQSIADDAWKEATGK